MYTPALLLSIPSPKHQSEMTNPFFQYAIVTSSRYLVEQNCYSCCKFWYTIILKELYPNLHALCLSQTFAAQKASQKLGLMLCAYLLWNWPMIWRFLRGRGSNLHERPLTCWWLRWSSSLARNRNWVPRKVEALFDRRVRRRYGSPPQASRRSRPTPNVPTTICGSTCSRAEVLQVPARK